MPDNTAEKKRLKELTRCLFDFADEYYPKNHPQQITDTIRMIEDVIEMLYK
jgi:hypothetical protein